MRLHLLLTPWILLAVWLLPTAATAQPEVPPAPRLLRVHVVLPVVQYPMQRVNWQPQQPDTCYTIKRVYVQSHWEIDEGGNRRYVPGHWTRRKVAVRCPEQRTAPNKKCTQPSLSDERFKRLYSAINARSFEMNKMTLALELVQTQCLSSAQVRAVVRLFKYEESRLRIATVAYNNTVDKANYQLVRESLRFKVSREKLDRYIYRQRHTPNRGQAPVRRGY